jgi:capsid assembly protease
MEHAARQLIHVRNFIENHVWAMTEDAYMAMVEIIENHLTGKGAEIYAAISRLSGKQSESAFEMLDNVAVVPINGTIVPRGSMMADVSAASSPASIQSAFNAAMASDADVVVMDINSPGGTAQGIEETADLIYNSRKNSDKLVLAYSNGMMASGAMWLGAQADEVITSPDATVGSVGVITKVTDTTRKERNEGIDTHVIRSGPNKQIGAGPVTQSQLDVMKGIADQFFGSFVGAMERGRGKKMNDDVKTGRVYLGKQAMDAGLVDRTSTFNDLINTYRKRKQ